MTPYYDDGQVTIFCGKAEDVLPTIADTSIDVTFTSPPYNRGNMKGGLANLAGGYDEYEDQMPHLDYVAWQREILADCWRCTSARGAIFYNHKPRIVDGVMWLPTELNPGLPLRQVIIWDPIVGINWSPSHFIPRHEWIMVFAKPAFALHSRAASVVGDVWRIRVEVPKTGRPNHPAPFPLRLVETALGAIPTGTLLDPFMGSGTALRAAKNHGWRAIGIEKSERYCAIAVKRLAQTVLPLEPPA